jgi:hypothetical protein
MYNRAITMAFESHGTIQLAAGTYALPFGVIDVDMNPESLPWGDRELVDFLPVAEFEVHGLRNRYRMPGVGAPLAARTVPLAEGATVAGRWVAPRARVAATALLRLPDVHAGIVSGHLRGTLDIYAASTTETADVAGRQVPLEIEETATIAAQLATSPIWKREISGFFRRRKTFYQGRHSGKATVMPKRTVVCGAIGVSCR